MKEMILKFDPLFMFEPGGEAMADMPPGMAVHPHHAALMILGLEVSDRIACKLIMGLADGMVPKIDITSIGMTFEIISTIAEMIETGSCQLQMVSAYHAVVKQMPLHDHALQALETMGMRAPLGAVLH